MRLGQTVVGRRAVPGRRSADFHTEVLHKRVGSPALLVDDVHRPPEVISSLGCLHSELDFDLGVGANRHWEVSAALRHSEPWLGAHLIGLVKDEDPSERYAALWSNGHNPLEYERVIACVLNEPRTAHGYPPPYVLERQSVAGSPLETDERAPTAFR